jgi:hypothetical protein
MGRKLNLTKQILDTINSPPSEELALMTWWSNIQDTGGMGLTNEGFRIFTEILDLEHYDWEFPDNKMLGNRIVLALDRKMEFPYYIKQPKGKRTSGKIFLFGERDAVLINLCGDLTKFVENTLR